MGTTPVVDRLAYWQCSFTWLKGWSIKMPIGTQTFSTLRPQCWLWEGAAECRRSFQALRPNGWIVWHGDWHYHGVLLHRKGSASREKSQGFQNILGGWFLS